MFLDLSTKDTLDSNVIFVLPLCSCGRTRKAWLNSMCKAKPIRLVAMFELSGNSRHATLQEAACGSTQRRVFGTPERAGCPEAITTRSPINFSLLFG